MNQEPWYHNEEDLLAALGDSHRHELCIPGYSDLEEIAKGGQGIVYRAKQLGTDRVVAIKVLYEGASDVTRRRMRFEREIELASMLQHPHVVRVYDGGALPDGPLFVVMEYVHGIPLDRSSLSNASADDWTELFVRVCDGVAHAHRHGVIHRDLKPSNVLVTPDGNPHILDFGIARLLSTTDHNATVTGDFVGTLAFASPEQLQGDPHAVDVRADIYAIGVMMYRALAGQPPYDTSGSLSQVVQSVLTAVPAAPSTISNVSNRELDAVVAKALAKNPDERYSSVEQLAEDLCRYQNGEALLARSHRKWYVTSKLIRRHWAKLAVAATLLLTLLAFTATTTTLWRQALREQKKTNDIKVFWEDTLGSISAGEERTVSFDEVLDEAVHWVSLTTSGEPEIEASLRLTIGNGYRCLGQYDKATAQLQKSLDLRRDLFGVDHPDVIQSINAQALLLKSQGDVSGAVELYSQALDARRRLLGADHPVVAQSLQNIGRLYLETDQLSAAAAAFSEALAIRQQHFAGDDPAIATVLFNQGDLALRQQDFAAAEDLHRQVLRMRQKRLAPTHPDIARSFLALARVLLKKTGHETALPETPAREMLEQALQVRMQSLPPEHPLILEVRGLMAADRTSQ